MFISNKRIKPPTSLIIADNTVEVVDIFKLLGVTIDNKLNFLKHAANLRLAINKKLYSIKRLFFLSTSVKLQFFKTFIMPYFDYTLSLLIYMPKNTIQKIKNCFDYCLFKLLNFKIETYNALNIKIDSQDLVNDFNFKLEKYGLFTFEHRFITRITQFTHKIMHNKNSPEILVNAITINNTTTNNYTLRNKDLIIEPLTFTHYGEFTFQFFFSKLINKHLSNNIYFKFNDFKKNIFDNLNIIYTNFISTFKKFNLQYKYTNYINIK